MFYWCSKMDLPDEIIKDLDRNLSVIDPSGLYWCQDDDGRWTARCYDTTDLSTHNYTIVKVDSGYIVAEIKITQSGMGGNIQ